MTARFTDHIPPSGTHAARPAAASTPEGAVYSCTDHSVVYRNDGAAWQTWLVLASSDLSAHLADTTDAHDASAISFVPAGTVAATDVQAALAELDAEKAAIGHTHGPRVRTINAQTGNAYTLAANDDFVTLANAAAVTLTVPTNATVAMPVGTSIDFAQTGAGQVTVAGAAGVTVNGTPGLKIAAQYGAGTLLKLATDTWLLVGRLSA